MQRLYVADISESVKTIKIETGLIGHKFNYDSELKEENISLTHYKAGTTICLKIFGNFTVETVCDRCAEPILADIDFSEEYYVFPEDSADEDIDYIYNGEYIDLESYINDSIVVNIPQKILCDEECKGVCPKCGINLNEKDCKCDKTFENF